VETQLDEKLLKGIELFNHKEFFDCHEILEELWNEQQEPEKQLTQGIIQIAVAYYHAGRDNSKGAIKLLTRGIPRVKPFLPQHNGMLLKAFLDAVEEDLETLKSGTAQTLRVPSIDFHIE